jgi:hypothetical protein
MNLGRWTAEGSCPHIAFLSARGFVSLRFPTYALRPFGFAQGRLWVAFLRRFAADIDGNIASVPQRLKPGDSEVLVSRRPGRPAPPSLLSRR